MRKNKQTNKRYKYVHLGGLVSQLVQGGERGDEDVEWLVVGGGGGGGSGGGGSGGGGVSCSAPEQTRDARH